MHPDPRKGVAAVDCCPTPGTIFAVTRLGSEPIAARLATKLERRTA